MARGRTRHGGRRAPGWRAVVSIAAICAACSTGTALAADPASTPSGEVLRHTYPLKTDAPKTQLPATAPARPVSDRTPVPAVKQNADVTPVLTLVVLLAIGAASLLGVAWHIWRHFRRDGPESAGSAAPPEPDASNEASNRRRPRAGRRFEPGLWAMTGSPPDPAREWTAEIAWRNTDGRSRFVVGASPGDEAEVAILTSDAIEWPPRGAEGVAALEGVVSGLEAQMLEAGWTAVEPGNAWFAKRFAWAPREAAPDPAMATSPSPAEQPQPAPSADRPELSSG
jgi:hypothetical protein